MLHDLVIRMLVILCSASFSAAPFGSAFGYAGPLSHLPFRAMASFRAQEKTSEATERRGAQYSNASQFNMVAERAKRDHGRSDSEGEGSEQQDLPGEQQQNNPERELQRRRFYRIRRIDSRDIQNKFNNNVQSTVGPVPSEPNHLGLERA